MLPQNRFSKKSKASPRSHEGTEKNMRSRSVQDDKRWRSLVVLIAFKIANGGSIMFLKPIAIGTILLLLATVSFGQDSPLFVVLQNQKWGFMDRDGKIAIPAQFEYENFFSEGLAQVTVGKGKDRLIGYIDPHGTMVIPPRYYQAGDFSEGLAPVAFETAKTEPCVDCSVYDWNMQWGYIDKTGRLAV